MADDKAPEQFSDQELLDAELALEAAGTLEPRDKSLNAPIQEEYSDEQLLQAQDEVSKYGKGSEIAKAALEGAARGATIGLSDLALPDKAAAYAREIENPVVSTVSDIATTVGASLLTGGAGAAARGATALTGRQIAKQAARTLAAPVVATEAIAKKAGELTAKALGSKVAEEIGRKKFVQEVIKNAAEKGVQLGTEGALYGAGRAVSDDALGKADLTAENFIAHASAGALLGGGIGGALGVGKAAIPAIKSLTAPVTKKVSAAFDKLASPEEAAMNIAGLTPSQVVKLERNVKDFKPRSVDYLRKVVNEASDDAETIAKTNEVYLDSSTKRLKSVISEIDESTKKFPEILPSRTEFYAPIIRDLDEIAESYAGLGKTSKQLTAPVEKLANDLRTAALKKKPLSFSEIENQRKLIGKIIQKQKRAADPTLALEGARAAYGSYRRQIDAIADKVERVSIDSRVKALATDLKSLNSDIEMGLTLRDALAKKAEKSAAPTVKELLEMLTAFNLAGTVGSVVGLGRIAFKRNTLQNLALKGDLATANSNIKKKISDFIPAIVEGAKLSGKAARITGLYALANSGLATKRTESGKLEKPENQSQAYNNIKENLSEYVANPEALQSRLIRATAKLNAHAPEVGSQVSDALTRATFFLYKKLPKDPGGSFQYPFQRDYEPSSLDLAKFRRYVQAVENPTSILDEAQKGTLTREHVEAVKQVYPVLYNQIRSEVYNYMAERGKQLKIPYNKRILLGSLLDLPLDQSLEAAFIMDLQASAGAQQAVQDLQQPSPQTAVNPTVGGLKDVDIAGRKATETQTVLERRRT